MKLIFTEFNDYVEISVMDGCLRLHAFTFKNKAEAKAFTQGFSCAKMVAINAIQSLPSGYNYTDGRLPKEPEMITIGPVK